MAGGSIDLFTSRRDCFDRCRYWKREEKTSQKLTVEKKPDGFFYAKEESAHIYDTSEIGSTFQHDTLEITISTMDRVGIEARDIVEFDGEIWNVLSVTKVKVHKSQQFMRRDMAKTYLRMKR